MKIKTHILNLKSRYIFRIAHGARTETKTFVVELQDGDYTGYGEATPVPYYGITPESMQQLIEDKRELIENYELKSPEDFWEYLRPHFGHNHFAQCALDIAAYDLWAKKQHQPLYKLWGLKLDHNPVSNYTIGIDEIEVMVQKMKEFDFPVYKIKLGTENDLEIVKALRKHTDAVFRVDANCGWGVEETIRNSEELVKYNVEFIEQPLLADNLAGMKEVIKYSALPLVADESCIVEEDVERCHGYFNAINIKLAKCGGLTPARRMIRRARELDMKIMVGCMTETSIGISAIGQLLPLIDYVDMDGSILISNDPAEGVYLDKGVAIYPERDGTGAAFKSIISG